MKDKGILMSSKALYSYTKFLVDKVRAGGGEGAFVIERVAHGFSNAFSIPRIASILFSSQLELEPLPDWDVDLPIREARPDFESEEHKAQAREWITGYGIHVARTYDKDTEKYDYPDVETLKAYAKYMKFQIFEYYEDKAGRQKNKVSGRAPEGWPTHRPTNKTEMLSHNLGIMMNRKSFDLYARSLARMLNIEVRMVEILECE